MNDILRSEGSGELLYISYLRTAEFESPGVAMRRGISSLNHGICIRAWRETPDKSHAAAIAHRAESSPCSQSGWVARDDLNDGFKRPLKQVKTTCCAASFHAFLWLSVGSRCLK